MTLLPSKGRWCEARGMHPPASRSKTFSSQGAQGPSVNKLDACTARRPLP